MSEFFTPSSVTAEQERRRRLEGLGDLLEYNRLLQVQFTAQIDRTDFLEDCIAEMAGQIYM